MNFRWVEVNLETKFSCGKIGRMEDVKNSYNLKSSGIKYNFLDFMELQIYGKKLEDFDFE